jgi:Tetratricopeptide repeat/Aspartyl protease
MRKLLFLFALAGMCAADSSDPLAIYKSGDYARALPLLQDAVGKNPKNAVLQAELLSALVFQGRVDEAADVADEDAQNFPQSPDVLAARGELAFYMGDMPQAESLFKAALKLDGQHARAAYGLSKLHRAASNFRTARLLSFGAYQSDPDDGLIALTYSRYLVGEKRQEFLPEFMKNHPWFYPRLVQMEESSNELRQELEGRKSFELDGSREETTVPLFYLHDGPSVVGLGIHLTIEGGKRLSLMLDTGASGILLSQSAIDRAGLKHVGSGQVGGIGDKGMRNTFMSVAETCTIGVLKYKTCIFGATEGKKRAVEAEDGLFGTDFFSGYLITVDFQRSALHLVPLPERQPSPQGYDRTPLPQEQGFTPIFRFGHHLYVSTIVNRKATGLFLIDTGSNFSCIDNTFARLTTKIHGNQYVRVKGVSGTVRDVFEADKAELQFGRFRQNNLGLTSINLNNMPEHQEVRMSGILGIQVLPLFRLTLDYRNGLVNFDYILDRKN